ncbi:MAG: alpha/beta hydrolase [Ferruginibacter sp.]
MKYIKVLLISLAVILATALVIAYLFYSKANTELYTLDATARKDVAGSFITLKDGVTHYELSGADTGKVVVLVHGFSVPYYIWDSTFSRLVQEGFRVLRYDEFGRGFSDRPDVVYEAPLFRRQLSDLLDGLHIKSVHAIAGLSFGGPVVADFVGHNPGLVSKVILVDPVYPEAGPQDMPFSESFQRYKMALSPETMVSGQLTDLKYPARFPSWADQYKVQM